MGRAKLGMSLGESKPFNWEVLRENKRKMPVDY